MTNPAADSAEILLCAINATWEHASFGLRCLMAALGPLQERAAIHEFTIKDRPSDIVERILQRQPQIVGLGVYIWNSRESLEVVRQLRALRPELVIVLGGPEVSFETTQQEIVDHADYVVIGEGEQTFRALCASLLPPAAQEERATPAGARDRPRLPVLSSGEAAPGARPPERPRAVILPGDEKPDLHTIFGPTSPYAFYTDEDLDKRIVYLEASRGCPYSCEFCLSSLDQKVRPFPLDWFLSELETLLARGLLRFKFVDRTFNLKIQDACRILDFFLERMRPGLFLHFEMIPDRLPDPLRERLARFPKGSVQLEVGIQTFDPYASEQISRRQNVDKLEDNLRWLRANTGVHIHADLIAGLPGEDVVSFGAGFDRLLRLAPHEIQLGVLKRLRGAPIDRHRNAHAMVFSKSAPYEVLQTDVLRFDELQRLKRLARHFDMIHNSGRFLHSRVLLQRDAPFANWMSLSQWLWEQTGATAGISLARLSELLLTYLVDHMKYPEEHVRASLTADLGRGRVSGLPRRQAFHATA